MRLSSDRRQLRSTAKGWGCSGALSDPLITRTSDVHGFVAVLPQPNTTLFIGLTTLTGSLYDKARAHQEDLDFALRLAADGTLSYTSRERAATAYHALQIEQDVLGVIGKGEAVGMRLSADRTGFSVISLDAASVATDRLLGGAEGGGDMARQYKVLKHFNEVMSFPLKVMVVFGSSKNEAGPICWLRAKSRKVGTPLLFPPSRHSRVHPSSGCPHLRPNASRRRTRACGGLPI